MSIASNVEFVAFRLETTGLSPYFNQIVEVGAVRFRADGTEVERMQQLVDPRCRMPIDDNGITDEMLQGQPTSGDMLPDFLRIIGGSDSVLLAHNAFLQLGFLSVALSRSNINVPMNSVVDTLALSKQRLWNLANHKLVTVADYLGIAGSTAHRALDGALVVQAAFLKLLALSPWISQLDDLFELAPPICFETVVLHPPTVPQRFQPLVDAMKIGRCISIVYNDGARGRLQRQITPIELIETHEIVYLIAHSDLDDMEETFRLDWIVEINVV